MAHTFSIVLIASELLFWIIQKALDLIPVLEPFDIPGFPPDWFLVYNSQWYWIYGIEDDKPSSDLCSRCLRSLFRILGDWCEEIAPYVLNLSYTFTRGLVGNVPSPWGDVAGWLGWVKTFVGTTALAFWDSLPDAVYSLRDLFPLDIVQAWKTWDDLWDSIVERAKEWVHAQYDALVALGQDAHNWVVNFGQSVSDWWGSRHWWLDDFMENAQERVKGWLGVVWDWVEMFWSNPYGYITSKLDPWWTQLVNFCGDPITFWYNMWGWYNDTIGPFFADPLGWLYDRVEAELVDRW